MQTHAHRHTNTHTHTDISQPQQTHNTDHTLKHSTKHTQHIPQNILQYTNRQTHPFIKQIFSNKSSRQVALELSNNKMIITTEDPEIITTGKETIECDYDGDPMTIGYNAFYLKEVLQHQHSDEIKIMLNTPLNAGLFVPLEQNENNNKTTLLMPIRLND